MLCFSWNPWHTPMPSSVAYGQSFPAALGLIVYDREERDAATRENGRERVYMPVYLGWM